ncbi:MAG: UDP-N-acetylmuramate dehydrogenase [Proteobacteria bacterium]|nr:UDP-N-acetylmuramate dehydrogenase [Pseudomonadota bacterium]
MNALTHASTVMESLPAVRGSYEQDAALGQMTWFRTGGRAEVLFKPADEEDFIAFTRGLPPDIPVTIIGVGSNLLVRDGGVRGVVVRMGKAMAEITIQDDLISAGAGALGVTIAARAQEAGLAGLEFLKGVPGSVGGALRMNAGAYGCEVGDIFVEARAIDRGGQVHNLTHGEMEFAYRHTGVSEDHIFLSAVFRGQAADRREIAARMKGIMDAREQSQPLRTRTGGSTFKNPDIEDSGRKAWQLIDEAGCRGLTVGGAMVSEKHCNFLINTGDATAADLENLGDEVRSRVLESTGVALEWEIRRIGNKGAKLS